MRKEFAQTKEGTFTCAAIPLRQAEANHQGSPLFISAPVDTLRRGAHRAYLVFLNFVRIDTYTIGGMVYTGPWTPPEQGIILLRKGNT